MGGRPPVGGARDPGGGAGGGPRAADEGDPAVTEQHLEVPRSARFLALGEPGEGLREIWFVLHGYRQLARRFLRRFRPLVEGGSGGPDGARLVVAPEGLSRFYLDDEPGPHGPDSVVGATWMTREDRLREIRDYVRYLDLLHDHVLATYVGEGREPPEVHVLGFSQGAETAARWIALGDAPADRLILWAAALPPDPELEGRARERLAAVELVLVHGEDDPLATSRRVEAARARLEDAGIPFRRVTFAGGHEIDRETLVGLAGA